MPSKIEWTDETWNPVTGCTPISEGCLHCYAERMSKRLAGRFGYPKDDPFKPGVFHKEKLNQPHGWVKPRMVFVCSMADLFHEAVNINNLRDVWDVIALAVQHTFQVLTKRPEMMRDVVSSFGAPSNAWMGVTAENQQRYDDRVSELIRIPAAIRYVSIEPMLGPIHLGEWGADLDWVILGGETGPGARHMDPQWAVDVARQCESLGVPFFFKQWGAANKVTTLLSHKAVSMRREYPRGGK